MRVLLYDQNVRGHSPSWVYCVAKACLEKGHELVLATCDVELVNEWTEKLKSDGIQKAAIPEIGNRNEHFARALTISREYKCQMLLCQFMDDALIAAPSFAAEIERMGIGLGGIVFRPPSPKGQLRDYLQYLFIKVLRVKQAKALRRTIRHRMRLRIGLKFLNRWAQSGHLVRVMSLNNHEHLQHLRNFLPLAKVGKLKVDPCLSKSNLSKEQARLTLNLPKDHFIFMHCGLDDPRKGLDDALKAWLLMSVDVRAKSLLLRAGAVGDSSLCDQLDKHGRLINRHIPQRQLDDLYAACDCVLLPYRDHQGTSGVLVNAAAAMKPVIAPKHSVLGKMVKDYDLGYSYPHLDINGLSKTMELAVCNQYIPSDSSREFVRKNSEHAFNKELADFFFSD